MPESDLEKMRASGPLKRNFPMLSSPELNEVARLMKTSTLPVLHYRNDGLSLTLKRCHRDASRGTHRHRPLSFRQGKARGNPFRPPSLEFLPPNPHTPGQPHTNH